MAFVSRMAPRADLYRCVVEVEPAQRPVDSRSWQRPEVVLDIGDDDRHAVDKRMPNPHRHRFPPRCVGSCGLPTEAFGSQLKRDRGGEIRYNLDARPTTLLRSRVGLHLDRHSIRALTPRGNIELGKSKRVGQHIDRSALSTRLNGGSNRPLIPGLTSGVRVHAGIVQRRTPAPPKREGRPGLPLCSIAGREARVPSSAPTRLLARLRAYSSAP